MVTPRVATPSGMAEIREVSSRMTVSGVLAEAPGMLFFFCAPEDWAGAFLFCGLLATAAVSKVIRSETLTTAQ